MAGSDSPRVEPTGRVGQGPFPADPRGTPCGTPHPQVWVTSGAHPRPIYPLVAAYQSLWGASLSPSCPQWSTRWPRHQTILGGALCGKQDLWVRGPRGRTVHTVQYWLHHHPGSLQPTHWQQAPKDWKPGTIWPGWPTSVSGSSKAKTIPERVVCHQGHKVKVKVKVTTMEDTMGMLGWAVVLPVCSSP